MFRKFICSSQNFCVEMFRNFICSSQNFRVKIFCDFIIPTGSNVKNKIVQNPIYRNSLFHLVNIRAKNFCVK